MSKPRPTFTLNEAIHRAMSIFDGRPYGPIEIDIEIAKVEAGELSLEQPGCRFHYDDAYRLALNCSFPDPQLRPLADSGADGKVYLASGDEIDLLALKRSVNLGRGSTEIEFTPCEEPVTIAGAPSVTASAAILNGPELTIGSNHSIKLEMGDLNFEVRPFSHTGDLFKSRPRDHSPPAVTHLITATSSKAALGAHEMEEQLWRLAGFIDFVKGSRVGVGHVVCHYEGPDQASRTIGFTKADRFKVPQSWYYPTLAPELPALCSSYLLKMSEAPSRRNLGRALQYYKASNTAQSDATEIALLISAAGLEALSYHILASVGGWSNDLLKRATLADMLRAAARLVGVVEDPVVHSEELRQWVKEVSRSEYDGFNVLADFRNGLTHPVPRFRYDGQKLWHAWCASQWLLEVTLLAYFGYRGKYQDRRRQLGSWKGTLYPMPVD